MANEKHGDAFQSMATSVSRLMPENGSFGDRGVLATFNYAHRNKRLVLFAGPFSSSDPSLPYSPQSHLLPETMLTNSHGLTGFAPNAEILNWSLVAFDTAVLQVGRDGLIDLCRTWAAVWEYTERAQMSL